MEEQKTPQRRPCEPEEFDWIAHQNPGLAYRSWSVIAETAGAIVANDIMDRVRVFLFDDEYGSWRTVVLIDGYTDGPEEGIPPVKLDDLLATVSGNDGQNAKNLVEVLRRHVDRLERELAAL